MNQINRRGFLAAGAVVAGAQMGLSPVVGGAGQESETRPAFKLKYGPHFGMFEALAGKDLIDQIKFAHDQGFRAWEDNGMMGRDPATQEKIGKALDDLGMTMGVFVAHAEWSDPMYVRGTSIDRGKLKEQMKAATETAGRVHAKWATVVPGPKVDNLEWDYQTANVIDCLRSMCEVCEPAGLTMVLEPLNPWVNHPGLFLTKVPQAYMICEAVNSPSCKILDDLYHQQITEGHLIRNMDKAWEQIAYIQVGDNPGRNEPTTGEINYKNVFKHLHEKGYQGVVGMEHGNSKGGKEGAQAVIDAYREVDDF